MCDEGVCAGEGGVEARGGVEGAVGGEVGVADVDDEEGGVGAEGETPGWGGEAGG